ncbi:hypothetical protein GOODEAATRI_006506, partial [Goodea atripinnis]
VLTADLEKQAAELQDEELPVATPIINIPHISVSVSSLDVALVPSSPFAELMGGEQRETGRIPRTVECHLTSDLCDSCVPGDTVTIAGIVRVINDAFRTELMSAECLGQLSKSGGEGSGGLREDRTGGEEFSLKQLYAIQEIQSQPNLLRLIVQ